MFRLYILICFLLFSLLSFSSFVFSSNELLNLTSEKGVLKNKDEIKVKYSLYEIRGTTVNELNQERNRKMGAHYAYTAWKVNYSFDYNQKTEGCSIQSVDTTVNILYRLPHWKNQEEASDQLREKWRKFITVLKIHEEGHANNGKISAEELKKKLLNMKQESSCDELGRDVEILAQSIAKKYKQKDLDYDTSTDHGKKQGAYFRN